MVEKEEKESETETSGLMIYDEGFEPEWNIRKKTANTDEQTGGYEGSAESDHEEAIAQSGEALPVAVTESKKEKIEIMMHGKTLREALGTIVALGISEMKIRAKRDGMTITQVTPDHVALVSLSIPRESLIMYYYDTTAEAVDIALEVDNLYKLTPYTKDVLLLSVPVENGEAKGKLIVEINGTTAEIDLMDPTSIVVPRVPELKVKDYAVMPTKKFKDAMKAIKQFSDSTEITFDAETVKIGTHTFDDRDTRTETVFKKEEIKELVVKTPGEVYYPTDYMSRIANGIKATEFRMTLKKDYPVEFDFYLPSGADNIKVTYLLAPRINQ